MATYSIDLGIDANATAGAIGTEEDPYPLQIALTEGVLEFVNGQAIAFRPKALASFTRIQSDDTLIFSLFDITSIGSTGERLLIVPKPFSIRFTNLDGVGKSPWSIDSLVAGLSPSRNQESLAFVRGSKTSWPCFFQWNNFKGIVTNTVVGVTAPTSYLLRVTVPVLLKDAREISYLTYFQTDPEMVISPDEGPPVGDEAATEDRAPGQPSAAAATSR